MSTYIRRFWKTEIARLWILYLQTQKLEKSGLFSSSSIILDDAPKSMLVLRISYTCLLVVVVVLVKLDWCSDRKPL